MGRDMDCTSSRHGSKPNLATESMLGASAGLILVALVTLFLPISAIAQRSPSIPPISERAWFKPTLTVDNDPVCSRVLRDTQRIFFSRESFYFITNEPGLAFAGMNAVEVGYVDVEVVTTHGERLYLRSKEDNGCGGTCNKVQLAVSENPFPTGFSSDHSIQLQMPNATPLAQTFRLFRAPDQKYFVATKQPGSLSLYSLNEQGVWVSACEVALEPKNLREVADVQLQTALASVDALKSAVAGVRRDAGDCGSMRTHGRWTSDVEAALLGTLYRPWPWSLAASDTRLDDDYDYYADFLEDLELWSLTGISEYEALAAYRAQLAETVRQLASFYSTAFAWSPADSLKVAEMAATHAASSGFGFPGEYQPFPSESERQLRRAILDRRPIAEIKSVTLDIAALDRRDEYANYRDSILNVAVKYPEALNYLLEHGADPNLANEFGKTPLMYAAQYNQLQAVKLLIARYADPNAGTVWPGDRCYYTLDRANMTPLHYAVRYASAEVIELLLKKGAVTFSKTVDRSFQHTDEYPLNWLERYGSPNSAERNPNITGSQLEHLAQLLRVPDAKELPQIAARLITQGEEEYAAGNTDSAFRTLSQALRAQPDNLRALSDMSLVALKLGVLGESLQASVALLARGASEDQRANAWFNRGLACEQNGGQPLFYGDQHYCREDLVYLFLRAWLTKPDDARAQKLNALFEEGTLPSCVITPAGSTPHRYYFISSDNTNDYRYNPTQKIYVHHLASQSIDASEIKWSFDTLGFDSKQIPKTVVPRLVERYDLGKYAITALESTAAISQVVRIGNHRCRNVDQTQ